MDTVVGLPGVVVGDVVAVPGLYLVKILNGGYAGLKTYKHW